MDVSEHMRIISVDSAKAALPVVATAVAAFAQLAGARNGLLSRKLVTPFMVTLNTQWGEIVEAGVMVEHSAMPGTVWCLYCDPGDIDEDGETHIGPVQWVVDVMIGGDFTYNADYTDDAGVVWKRGSDGVIREAYRGNQSDALSALMREVAASMAASAIKNLEIPVT